MRQQASIKTIALGGRPQGGIMQAVGGVKGTNDYPWDYIYQLVNTRLFRHCGSESRLARHRAWRVFHIAP